MSVEDRLEYIRAVYCLMKLPSKAPKDEFPGALTRFDDFIAYHMVNSPKLHDNFNLLPAHRYFIYAYEQVLRSECGYKGYQPVSSSLQHTVTNITDTSAHWQYMNYNRLANDPINSAMFNGNASSMGGNGEPDPAYAGARLNSNMFIKSAGGGGCVKSGPFSEFVPRPLHIPRTNP